ncbi:hypothetical protein QBC38DRAFT_99893 [Podospora fimiseda]|uniref:Uncharacterized protein n=1 Tax=Podospora fimiseda TaxID=252190 RepID=A0AAN6YMT6_9PEZI|nr:hypothetical protein QBC38DRAFT_99893 [Podospora fimiseda]
MLLAGSIHSHHDGRQPAQPTIKTAMAAGFGSSLFFFRGFSSISSHILQEASRPSSSSSSSSSSSTTTSSSPTTTSYPTMGSCHSIPDHDDSRPNTSTSESQAPLIPRPQKQKHNNTCKNASPKAEYRLSLQCTECNSRHKIRCPIAPDLEYHGNTRAYSSTQPHFTRSNGNSQRQQQQQQQQQLKEWILQIDFCGWSRTKEREIAIQVLGKHMRSSSEKKGQRPFRVEDLLGELEGRGVKFESWLGGGDEEEKDVARGWERV